MKYSFTCVENETESDPCVNHTVWEANFTRTVGFTSYWEIMDDCESTRVTAGWYRYSNSLNIPTVPPRPGQCGTWYPIWLNGNLCSFRTKAWY